MTTAQKATLGFLTFSPLVGMGLYFVAFMSMFLSFPPNGGSPEGMFATMNILFAILMITALLSLGLMVYYLMHAANNKQLNQANSEHLVWILIILFAGVLGQIVYWYLKIWKDDSPFDEGILDA